MSTLEVFFDCSSPWTYLAFHNIRPMAKRLGQAITWKPILVGGIFNSVNPSVYEQRANPVPAKGRYMGKDLRDWARYSGIEITFPPKVFPVNSVKAMRGCIWLQEQGDAVMEAFADRVFRAYWSENRDISQDAELAAILDELGLEETAFFAAIGEQKYKDALKANTEEVIARGGFGSPTIFVNGDDMYFGNDRLVLVEAALERAR
ncbi:MAG: 2-hydroxychromene-2-carboxylate isomerase [Caulobacteraceae bacterium]